MARNRKISTEIAGQRVEVGIKFMPSPDNPKSLQWKATVPIADVDLETKKRVFLDKNAQLVRGSLNVWKADKYQWLLKEDDKKQDAEVVKLLAKQQKAMQAEFDGRLERERDEVQEELNQHDERVARKTELEAEITARTDALREVR